MAEALKTQYGTDVPAAIATMVAAVHPAFPRKAFLRDVQAGYDDLELMPRGRHIARVLRKHLPQDVPAAMDILVAAAAQPDPRPVRGSLASFLFLPHTHFVAEFGLDHFEAAMRAQHALTQRFTCEFSIRPFLLHHPEATLARLRQWTQDPSEHVRRLVSEGTRTRLPWAGRLPAFQADPAPVVALLELLKDDPALYVRRSVANNLNDIGKDNPDVLVDTAARWLADAPPDRAWIVRHALRWAVKQGHPGALKVLGFGKAAAVEIHDASLLPARPAMGGAITIGFTLHNPRARPQELLVDLAVHYRKAGGGSSQKVFKLKTVALSGKASVRLQKKLSLAEMTTRKHHAGVHAVEVLVNGAAMPLGEFTLVAR